MKQLVKCLALARQMGSRDVIVAGDMNTEIMPGSCVAQILADAPEASSAEIERECSLALRLTHSEGSEEAADGAGNSDTAESATKAETTRPSTQQLSEWHALLSKAAAAPREYRIALSRVPRSTTHLCLFYPVGVVRMND